MLPMHDPVANMVTAMHAHNVESVMCDGVWLMCNREILCVDESRIINEAKDRAESIYQRASIDLKPRFNVVD
jgi:5-methylthioadenosine/S-adenosylhomocysteine deaminase